MATINDTVFTATDSATALPPEQPPAFEFRNLNRSFGKLQAVRDVSFKAYPGGVVGFIGPNGAGKTTSMRILATLDTPTSGDAFVMGYSVIDDPDSVRKVVGFMPDSYGRYANVSVFEYLDFFARAYGLRGDARHSAVDRVMTFTELHTIREKPIENLSKGLAQRLGLGRTLIHDPQVLILDEPAAGLDPRARVELRELIFLLAADLKKTVLISSHILTELSEICDSAVIIEAGRILASGTVDQIMDQLRTDKERTSAKITIRFLDDPQSLERELILQPFVSNVNISGKTATFEYEGSEIARAGLIRTLVQSGHQIVEFSSRVENLEDAFMAITKGIMQ